MHVNKLWFLILPNLVISYYNSIICLTETWLTPSISVSKISLVEQTDVDLALVYLTLCLLALQEVC